MQNNKVLHSIYRTKQSFKSTAWNQVRLILDRLNLLGLARYVNDKIRGNDYDVIVGGMESTGSTFVYQVLKALGRKPLKVHGYYARYGIKKIVTYRDPRDVICSYARRQLRKEIEQLGLEEGLLKAHSILFRKLRRDLDLYRYLDDSSAILIRYETYFGKHEEVLIDQLSLALGLPITLDEAKAIHDEFSLEKNKARSESLQDFSSYNSSLIHGGHISSGGKTAEWKELFTPRVKEIVEKDLETFLKDFHYDH